VVDIDGDGKRDVISGSYWPGDIFVFRGRGGWKFDKGVELKDASGRNLNAGPTWKSKDEPEMDSLAAAPHAVDFDGDGDLDVLVGNIQGRVILIDNEGTAKKPSFSTHRTALEADGQEIRVPGGDAGPVVADWDADGRPDLLVGAGDGSVWFYRNVAKGKKPRYAKGQTLITAAARRGKRGEVGEAPKRPGTRAKICATDYDGDGRIDLLVGDFASGKRPAPKLNAEQIATRDRLREERDATLAKYEKLVEQSDDAAAQRLLERYQDIALELDPLEAGTEYHGWVWLYLRTARSRL